MLGCTDWTSQPDAAHNAVHLWGAAVRMDDKTQLLRSLVIERSPDAGPSSGRRRRLLPAIGISLVVFKGRDHQTPLAFGPYLAIAGGIALFFGKSLIAIYLPA